MASYLTQYSPYYQPQYYPTQSPWSQVMGPASDIAQIGTAVALASDIRFKENIQKVGVSDGINIYEFNYKGHHGRYKGVIAQEVMNVSDAVVKDENGFFFVDYSKLPKECSFERVRG